MAYAKPWQRILVYLLALPVLFPLIAMAPSIITANTEVINSGVADVLGTGAAIALQLCLLITPLITVTLWRWLAPLRQWYGVVFAITAIVDAVTASIFTDFAGNNLDKIAGHTFLLVGAMMVAIGLVLLVTSNIYAKRWLGRYWKWVHRFIYLILALLLVHMGLLFGFGIAPDDTIWHQRFYQICACALVLIVFRIPAVKRWTMRKRKENDMLYVWLLFIPLMILFSVSMGFQINEAIFKGTTVIMLNPVVD